MECKIVANLDPNPTFYLETFTKLIPNNDKGGIIVSELVNSFSFHYGKEDPPKKQPL